MINLILIKNGNPERNTETSQISIPCPVQFDTDLVPHLAQAGWANWDDFFFELGQDPNCIRNGYEVIYFRIKKSEFRQISFMAEGEHRVARISIRIFYSLFVHASGTVAIARYELDGESQKVRVIALRPRAYFNNLTDIVVSARQLTKEKVALPTAVLQELARRTVYVGGLITRRPATTSTIETDSPSKVVEFSLERRAKVND